MSRKALIIIKLAAIYIVLVMWFLLASIVNMGTLIHQHRRVTPINLEHVVELEYTVIKIPFLSVIMRLILVYEENSS